MKNNLMKLLVSCALAFCASPAFALYYCKCDTGAQPGCDPGNDSFNGSTPTLAKVTPPTTSEINAAAAGTQYLFCQGGMWAGFGGFGTIVNTNATKVNRVIFDSYQDSWGGAGVRPRFAVTASPIIFGPFGDTTSDGGYAVRNLHLDGVSCANNISSGIYSNAKGVTDVLIENNIIEHFKIGVQIEQTESLRNERIAIRNNIIRRSWGTAGIFGDAHNLLIEGNTLERNGGDASAVTCGEGNGFSHAIYISGNGTNAIFRGNTISKSGAGGTGADLCSSGGITLHGTWDGVVVERNEIDGGASQTSNCGGIDLNAGYSSYERFANVRVSANTLKNAGITVSNAPGAIVENNRIVKSILTASIYAIQVPRDDGNGSGPTDEPMTAPTVRDNSIHFGPGLSNATGIKLNNASGHGNGAKVSGNLITFAGGGTGNKCFAYGALSQYTYTGNNLCNGFNTWASSGVTDYVTLANAQAAGFDATSMNSAPLYVTTPSVSNATFELQSGSPARDANNSTYCSRIDAIGLPRSACDIGAREYSAPAP